MNVDPTRWCGHDGKVWRIVTYAPKYVIVDCTTTPDSVTRAIGCKACGVTSYNPNDVKNSYCGRCHVFLDDAGPFGRIRSITPAEPSPWVGIDLALGDDQTAVSIVRVHPRHARDQAKADALQIALNALLPDVRLAAIMQEAGGSAGPEWKMRVPGFSIREELRELGLEPPTSPRAAFFAARDRALAGSWESLWNDPEYQRAAATATEAAIRAEYAQPINLGCDCPVCTQERDRAAVLAKAAGVHQVQPLVAIHAEADADRPHDCQCESCKRHRALITEGEQRDLTAEELVELDATEPTVSHDLFGRESPAFEEALRNGMKEVRGKLNPRGGVRLWDEREQRFVTRNNDRRVAGGIDEQIQRLARGPAGGARGH